MKSNTIQTALYNYNFALFNIANVVKDFVYNDKQGKWVVDEHTTIIFEDGNLWKVVDGVKENCFMIMRDIASFINNLEANKKLNF